MRLISDGRDKKFKKKMLGDNLYIADMVTLE